MKRIFRLVMAAFLCLLCSCGAHGESDSPDIKGEASDLSKPAYQKITAEQAKSILDGGETCIVLDVRTDEEFREQHIDGAVLIPDYELKARAESELTDKNALILIYCRSGRRSALAANELIGMGYTRIYDFGGIIDWPYETVNG